MMSRIEALVAVTAVFCVSAGPLGCESTEATAVAVDVADGGSLGEDAGPDVDGGSACAPASVDALLGCLTDPASCSAVYTVECDDGQACTFDYCGAAGECAHLDIVCDDSDLCTEDLCAAPAAGGLPVCSHLPVTCSGADDDCSTRYCDSLTGQCETQSVECDDGIACTVDACQPGRGCVFVADDEWCRRSTTQPGSACLAAQCAPGLGCIWSPDPGPCDDGNPCTGDDQCQDGECVGGQLDGCDDGEPCTTDVCTSAGECVHFAVECDDGDACTDDLCSLGIGCVFALTNCDDGDVCTVDECLSHSGCVHSPAACDDEDACTTSECDSTLGCVHHLDACDDGEGCTEDICHSKGGCLHVPIDCADGSVCTSDFCDPVLGCTFEPLICNAPPCSVSYCHPLLGCQKKPVQCPEGLPCTVSLGCQGNECVYVEDCDDGNVCTFDGCDSASGCIHSPVTCASDGDTSTEDTCIPGTGCVYEPIGEPICYLWGSEGEEVQCPLRIVRESDLDGWYAITAGIKFHFDTAKLEMLYLEDLFTPPGGDAPFWFTVPPGLLYPSGHTILGLTSGNSQNNNGKGVFTILHFSAVGMPLTLAYLDGDTIVGDPSVLWFRARLRLDISEADAVPIRVRPESSLLTPKGSPSYTTVYNEMLLLPDPECEVNADCDDGDLCTSDQCKLGGCIHGPKPTGPLLCTHTVCDPVLGIITPDCDDESVCTTDYCHPVLLECQFTPIDIDDSDDCTADFCDPILGVFHVPADCDDSSQCTDDGCVLGIGCVNTPNGCDDGVPCTQDACEHKLSGKHQCVHTPSNAICDDGNKLTMDVCDPFAATADALGCTHE